MGFQRFKRSGATCRPRFAQSAKSHTLPFGGRKALAVIIEVKPSERKRTLKAMAEKALQQIDEKQYAESFIRWKYQKNIKYGAAYYGNDKVLLNIAEYRKPVHICTIRKSSRTGSFCDYSPYFTSLYGSLINIIH